MTPLLHLLAGLIPRDFQTHFGEEIHAQIDHDMEQARRRGWTAVTRTALSTAVDLIRTAAAEYATPTRLGPGGHHDDEGRLGMGLSDAWNDVRHALRSLRRSPGFTATVVGTLGLALGASAGIFSIVDAVLLQPLPFENSDRLVHIAASAPGSDFRDEFRVSNEFYFQYREESAFLEDISTHNDFTHTFRTEDRVERVRLAISTPSLFTTLGAEPILGSLPNQQNASEAVVLSHGLWTTWFAQDPDVIGRTYQVAGAPRTVIGVMPAEFWFPREDVQAWITTGMTADQVQPGRFGTSLVARVAPDTDLDVLAAELTRLASRLPERVGGSANYARLIEQHRAVVRPLQEQIVGAARGPIWVLFGAVLAVLLIACANVANLLVVRGERRAREFALRRAIGAGSGPLVRLQMAEIVVLAALSGAVALVITRLGVPVYLASAPEVARLGDVGVTATTVVFTLAACLVCALVCGLVPAIRSARPSFDRLRDGGRGSTGRRHWGRDGLVVGQTAVALVLLIGSGLLLQSFNQLKSVDPGYDIEDIFTFQIAPEAEHLRDGPSFARFHLDFLDRLRGLPGVTAAGIVENVPLNEGVQLQRVRSEEMISSEDAGALIGVTYSGGDHFEVLGIDVLRGRAFNRQDHEANPGSVIMSASAAEALWPGQDPIGRRVEGPESTGFFTVVGVVEDVMQDDFRSGTTPIAYLPLAGPTATSWMLPSPGYVIRTERAETIAPEVRALVREVAPSAPMYRVFTMAGLADESLTRLSFTGMTLATAAALALILGGIGLYGVLSYVVAERTQEIGVRMALGAEAGRVERMVVAKGARVVALGVGLGIVVAVASTRLLEGLLFGVQPVDIVTFVAMAAGMLLVGLFASWLPARRAARVDPIQSLRAG